MRLMRRIVSLVVLISFGLLICTLLGLFVYNLPPIHERLSWRVANLRAEIRYYLNPPEQVVFIPQEQEGSVDRSHRSGYPASTHPRPAG